MKLVIPLSTETMVSSTSGSSKPLKSTPTLNTKRDVMTAAYSLLSVQNRFSSSQLAFSASAEIRPTISQTARLVENKAMTPVNQKKFVNHGPTTSPRASPSARMKSNSSPTFWQNTVE